MASAPPFQAVMMPCGFIRKMAVSWISSTIRRNMAFISAGVSMAGFRDSDMRASCLDKVLTKA